MSRPAPHFSQPFHRRMKLQQLAQPEFGPLPKVPVAVGGKNMLLVSVHVIVPIRLQRRACKPNQPAVRARHHGSVHPPTRAFAKNARQKSIHTYLSNSSNTRMRRSP